MTQRQFSDPDWERYESAGHDGFEVQINRRTQQVRHRDYLFRGAWRPGFPPERD